MSLRKIIGYFTIARLFWVICAFEATDLFFSTVDAFKINGWWNKIVDKAGATFEDRIWYISNYCELSILFFIIAGENFSSADGKYKIGFKFFFLLAWGKLVDQFFNPYGYHLPELCWGILATIWLIRELEKCRNRSTS
jgi:hypothetical protein